MASAAAAATGNRRELTHAGKIAVVTGSSAATAGACFFTGYLDRKLAGGAYGGQELPKPLALGRRAKLYRPLPGDHGAHGRFDDQALNFSAELWLATHRPALAVIVVVVTLLLWLGWPVPAG